MVTELNVYIYNTVEITSCILLNHNGIKLEIINKRKHTKYPNTWRPNNSHMNDQWVIKEIMGQI
jgi:hypothetical protein